MAITQDIGGKTAPIPSTDAGSLLYMHPTESAGSILLVQEEKQREFKPRASLFFDSLSFDSSALSVNSSSNEAMKSFRTNYTTNSNHYKGNRTRSYCDYCKKLGHTKARCYKLIAYPPRDKEKGNGFYQGQQQLRNYNRQTYNKGKGVVAAAVHDDAASVKGQVGRIKGPKEQVMSLSKEQYNQLPGIMQQYQDQNANANAGAINFADPFNEEASGDW